MDIAECPLMTQSGHATYAIDILLPPIRHLSLSDQIATTLEFLGNFLHTSGAHRIAVLADSNVDRQLSDAASLIPLLEA